MRSIPRFVLTLAALSLGVASAQSPITWWTRSSQVAQAQALADAYQKKSGVQIKLTPIPDANFVTKYGTAVAGGQAPDMISVDIVYMPVYTQTGQLEDITSFAKALPHFKDLSPSHIRLSSYQDKIYGLPLGYDASFLLYNKDLFKQAGLNSDKPPANFADILAASKKITALGGGVKGFYFSGNCGGCNAFTMMPLVWASGSDALNQDGTKANLDNPVMKKTLQLYRDLWTQGQVPVGAQTDNGTNFLNAFTSGKVGMMPSGNFAIAALKKDFPKLNFGVAYLPGVTGDWASFVGGDCIGISKGSPNTAGAKAFLKYIMSDEAQIEVVSKGGWLPVRLDLAANKYTNAEPRLVAAAKSGIKGKTVYTQKAFELFNDQNGPFVQLLQDAIFKGDIDGALKRAQSAFSSILNTK